MKKKQIWPFMKTIFGPFIFQEGKFQKIKEKTKTRRKKKKERKKAPIFAQNLIFAGFSSLEGEFHAS